AKPIQLQGPKEYVKHAACWVGLWERLGDLGDRAGAFLEAALLAPLSASEREVAKADLAVLRTFDRVRRSATSGWSS
ncbi:unnamed protein product, partial [Prorocentrum cordatum]